MAASSRAAMDAPVDALLAMREVSGYLGCVVVAGSKHKPVLVDVAQANLSLRERIIGVAQRYAALAETLFPSRLSEDRTTCPRELSMVVGEETHLVRCLDPDQGLRCLLVLQGAEPQGELARFRLRRATADLLEQARRERAWS